MVISNKSEYALRTVFNCVSFWANILARQLGGWEYNI